MFLMKKRKTTPIPTLLGIFDQKEVLNFFQMLFLCLLMGSCAFLCHLTDRMDVGVVF